MKLEIDIPVLAAFVVLLVVGILAFQHYGMSFDSILSTGGMPAMVGGC